MIVPAQQASPISIYNTLSRRKEPLVPLEEGHVKLYVCGITSYDYCHIGHARSVLVFDMVVRYLRYRGYTVTFIRNFTDIDDKIIDRAHKQQVEAAALAQRFIDEFYVDMDALGALRPDKEPRATGHVAEMLTLIQELMDKDMAYAAGGDVYYRVERFPEYGRLSGRSLEDMQAGARVEVNTNKQHPMDFVLWKAAKPGEPQWDSPWGPGRPGWHIECSAMSRKYLGDVFDIHGGGKDLIFPHHENEIAQSCGATGKDFARVWMHHGFVTIRDEKMSKSLGNFLTIREILKKYHPEVLRLFIFSAHYRSPIDFNEAALQDAQAGLERLYSCVQRLEALPQHGTAGAACITTQEAEHIAALHDRFQGALDNDFNSAQAIGYLFDAVKQLNQLADRLPDQAATSDLNLLHAAAADLRILADILGLLQMPAWEKDSSQSSDRLAKLGISEGEIATLIEERAQARAAKNWAASDAIRDSLLARGIALKDGPKGTHWEFVQ